LQDMRGTHEKGDKFFFSSTHDDGVEARQKKAARQFGASLRKEVSRKLVAAGAPFPVNYCFLCWER